MAIYTQIWCTFASLLRMTPDFNSYVSTAILLRSMRSTMLDEGSARWDPVRASNSAENSTPFLPLFYPYFNL
jgi:hypothetical protein